MRPEISILLAKLHGQSVEKMQETLNSCFKQLELYAEYLATRDMVNDFHNFERNKRRDESFAPPIFKANHMLQHIMPEGEDFLITDMQRSVSRDRAGAEITIKIKAMSKIDRCLMWGGERLKHQTNMQIRMQPRIDLEDLLGKDAELPGIDWAFPRRPAMPDVDHTDNKPAPFPGVPHLGKHFVSEFVQADKDQKARWQNTIDQVIKEQYVPKITNVNEMKPVPVMFESLDAILREVKIEEKDFLVPAKEPPCHCDGKALAGTTGHDEGCLYFKWKRNQ